MTDANVLPDRPKRHHDTVRRFSAPLFARVEPETIRRLDRLADQRQSSRSGVVRDALKIMFSLHEVDS